MKALHATFTIGAVSTIFFNTNCYPTLSTLCIWRGSGKSNGDGGGGTGIFADAFSMTHARAGGATLPFRSTMHHDHCIFGENKPKSVFLCSRYLQKCCSSRERCILALSSTNQPPNDESMPDEVGVPVSRYVAPRVFTNSFMRTWWEQKSYCMRLLTGAVPKKFEARKCVGKREEAYKTLFNLTLGGCQDMKYRDNIVESAREAPNVLIVPYDLQYPFIDFVYSELRDGKVHFHAFQVPSGDCHNAKVPRMKDFIRQIGDATASMYYMVLDRTFVYFVTNKVNPILELDELEQAKIELFHVSVAGVPEEIIPG
jgi:hypothetical protein